MYTLVFDAHHDNPKWVFPTNRHGDRYRRDQVVDYVTRLVTVVQYFCGRGPVVVSVVQVVPRHLIDADRKHRFDARVEAFRDQFGDMQLVNEEY